MSKLQSPTLSLLALLLSGVACFLALNPELSPKAEANPSGADRDARAVRGIGLNVMDFGAKGDGIHVFTPFPGRAPYPAASQMR